MNKGGGAGYGGRGGCVKQGLGLCVCVWRGGGG